MITPGSIFFTLFIFLVLMHIFQYFADKRVHRKLEARRALIAIGAWNLHGLLIVAFAVLITRKAKVTPDIFTYLMFAGIAHFLHFVLDVELSFRRNKEVNLIASIFANVVLLAVSVFALGLIFK